ncbi:MAG: DKNYY domain-containing protein [Dysgonomonas sp.]|nr:DKNYY domain-containing protein [Dysgonomonas sp.]
MRLSVIYLVGLVILTTVACRKERGVDFNKSPYYFYSQDSSKILYDVNRGITSVIDKAIYKDVTTDVKNFTVISKEFGKDSEHIYYTFIPIKNVDYASFYWDEKNELPKDKRYVYFPTTETETLEIVKGADPVTYEKVDLETSCLQWYKDKAHYFYNHIKTDADIETMSFECLYLPFDKKYVFLIDKETIKKKAYKDSIVIINKNMLRDSQTFYFKAECDSSSHLILCKDVSSLKYYDINEHIFRIDNYIYLMGVAINPEHINADSFEPMEYKYSKDQFHVYYGWDMVPEADPLTFVILSEEYSKDEKNVYQYGKVLEGYSPDNFKKDQEGRYPPDKDYNVSPTSRRSYSDDDDD